MTKSIAPLHFHLPHQLNCSIPTEERGLQRDEVRLLVTQQDGQDIFHQQFTDLPYFLTSGDILIVNNSATVAAALPIHFPNGQAARLHLSTPLAQDEWLAEIRSVNEQQSKRWKEGEIGQQFSLPQGGRVALLEPYYQNKEQLHLWKVRLFLPLSTLDYLGKYGRPIKYQNLDKAYPLAYYQTFFSSVPGSAEMPSAARGFTSNLVDQLLKKGVQIIPITLHTGVSSLETGEEPYPEFVEVSALAAQQLNLAKAQGKRIVAVGTTAVRAIESATDTNGKVQTFRGHSNLFIQPGYSMKIVDGLLTGFHEPTASHLYMLQALASKTHLQKAYQAAVANEYFWHEFGDLHLILTDSQSRK